MRGAGAFVLAAALMLSACQDVPGMQNDQQAGGLLGGAAGGIAGGLLGNSFGGFAGPLIGSVLGSVGGYLAGSAIGARLDASDRQRAQAATAQALALPQTGAQPGAPVAWSSDHNGGVNGSAQVVGEQAQANGAPCRDVREVAYINGQQTTQTSRYCRGANGAWTRQT